MGNPKEKEFDSTEITIHRDKVKSMVGGVAMLVIMGRMVAPKTEDKAAQEKYFNELLDACADYLEQDLIRHGVKVTKEVLN